MAVENNICLDCRKSTVCKIADKLHAFVDDVKTPLGVDIEIKKCKEFDMVVSLVQSEE